MASALKLSDALRNAQANAVESTIGTAPMLRIWSGSPPANCAAADSGTKLVEGNAPSDWLGAASSGAVAIANGPWAFTGHANAGAGTDGGHFRIYNNAGTVCHMQGTFGETADSPDMTADNKNIASGQAVNVTAFTYTRNNG
jgi:hypothetical protein